TDRVFHPESVHRAGPGRRAGPVGRLRRPRHAGGRHPRPAREPGHRLHRLHGPQPARDRGPGHLPPVPEAARARRGQDDPLVVRQLNSARGVSEVATVGGAPLEYQIDVKPEALRAYGVTLGDVYAAVARSNFAAGGGVIQKNNAEYLVRFVGWLKGKDGIEQTVIRRVPGGTPIAVENVATVQLGQ